MYLSYNDVRGFAITSRSDDLDAVDTPIDDDECSEKDGRLIDLYVDSTTWKIRYAVLETGSWFSSNRVLLSVDRLADPDVDARCIGSDASRQQIQTAPAISTVQTVSERMQDQWGVGYGHGLMLMDMPGVVLPLSLIERAPPIDDPTSTSSPEAGQDDAAQTHQELRSANELRGYAITGSDEKLGTVHDLIIDAARWTVAWLSIDSGGWLPGKLVVIAPAMIDAVSWEERCMRVSLTSEQVINSPALSSIDGLERSAEASLHAYYSLPMI